MENTRLATSLWVGAGIRAASAKGIPALLRRRGEPEAGTVVLKLNLLEAGCRVFTQSRDGAGELAWLPALKGATVPDADAEAYVARAIARDPDIWVVEVEDRTGNNPFGGKVL
jgi:hypothetical protein